MKSKAKTVKKASDVGEAHRLDGVPLIQDKTELITPETAEKMLKKNKSNRPINWNRVEQIRKEMEDGKWKFHAQGIILDDNGNLLTGQKRLWAIIYSGIPQYMRISKGSPPDTAHLIDRGAPQTSRDLASRQTERKHSPIEASLVRGMLALKGRLRPSVDIIAEGLTEHDEILEIAVKQTKGIKKSKAMLMIMSAICDLNKPVLFGRIEELADMLEGDLRPTEADLCWNRGAAFTLAMEKAVGVLSKA